MLQPSITTMNMEINTDSIKMSLNTILPFSTNINFSYNGIVIGYNIKNKDNKAEKNFVLSFYGRTIGTEISLSSSENFNGKITFADSTSINIDKKFLKFQTFQISTYYVFNNNKFSYPAAFTKNYIQKKNSGSWIISSNYATSNTKTKQNLFKINTISASLGIGYGYNWVIKSKNLIHISALPTFNIFEKNNINTYNLKQWEIKGTQDVIIIGRMTTIFNFKIFFTGIDAFGNFTIIGDDKTGNKINFTHTKITERLFFGIRFKN